jgi:hypothetical protein
MKPEAIGASGVQECEIDDSDLHEVDLKFATMQPGCRTRAAPCSQIMTPFGCV